ncbi:MAG: glycine--tRNA ligase [Akkermansiaceae bacterium]
MAERKNTDPEKMEKVVSLCKSKGFIFQSGELYGGLNGCWDYGPLGTELKRNVKEFWWRKNVLERDDIVGMDGSILTHQAVLTASGHVGGFSDPMCTCRQCKRHQREDQVWEQMNESEWATSLLSQFDGDDIDTAKLTHWATSKKLGKKLSPGLAIVRDTQLTLSWLSEKIDDGSLTLTNTQEFLQHVATLQLAETGLITPCPHCGGDLTEPKDFNLMFQTKMGATAADNDPAAVAYLRPETAQTIFVQYKNVLDSSRQKLPFGIAQIGKAFRNEVNPRNFTFRSREFEQMEIEYFCHPDDGLKLTDEWLEKRLAFYEEIGVPREKLHVLDIPDEERAHYSQKTYDIEYDFPFGQQELEGVAYRGAYDIGKHQEHSGKNLEYFDVETKEKFIPHVVEPSAGCDRTILAVLCEAYDVEDLTKEGGKKDERTVMRFKPCVAPIKAAILPLLKNKPELVAKAKEVKNLLQPHMNVFYDEAAAIGRRYRRQDEVGTPFCIAIDFNTLGEADEGGNDLTDTVTVRHRDSMEQERIAISDLLPWLLERIV